MDTNQFYLFKDKRFLPIFIVQFFGCLNDGIIKNSLIILITFKIAENIIIPPYILVMCANALFISPFILFASLAGQVADRYERSTIVKIIKFIEIFIVLLSVYGFYNTNLYLLFFCIALMGIHSTFFGPIKYSVLPDKLEKSELLGANGFIEGGTFLSILLGTIIGGVYNWNTKIVMSIAITASIVGFVSSFFMPKSYNENKKIKINKNIWQETFCMLKYATSKNQVYLAILGISWFWFIGTSILAQIPSLTRYTFCASEGVANLFLAIFSLGVCFGSFLCNKILSSRITTKYIVLSAIGISLVAIDLYFACKAVEVSYQGEHLKTVIEFLTRVNYWRILIDLFFISTFGGIYVVPLFAVMQYYTSPGHRSRVIAVNNLINSIFMALSTILLSFLFYINFSIPSVILIISIMNIIVAIYIYQFIPDSRIIPLVLWRLIFRLGFYMAYKIQVKGIDNFKKSGKRTVIVANHISYIDPVLIACNIPEEIGFAINLQITKEWWVKPFLKLTKTYPLEPNNPMAIKTLITEVKKNRKIAIFPEGRTSVTGSLMKVYEGPGMIADKTDATILPIRVDGTQFTIFSKVRKLMKGKFVFRRKITITILPPVKLSAPSKLDNRERRKIIGQSLYDIMSDMMFESSNYKETLFQSLINASKTYGKKRVLIQDIENNSASYNNILLKSFIIGSHTQKNSNLAENIGIMLPGMVATVITFFGIQSIGRVPAMINFTAGVGNILSACKTAQIKLVYTSRKFIKKMDLNDTVIAMKEKGINVAYLEELKNNVGLWTKTKSLFATFFPQTYYEYICPIRNDLNTATILFTSGTEGKPKAVALSHRNIQSNRCQFISRTDFNPYDCAFNALPLFHSFGLVGMLIMSLNGIKTFFYPSPLHYRIIPEVVYDIGATIMFSTDTFLAGYAAYAHPYDFYSLRYVIAGAEKLRNKTRKLWFDKFGIRIFEGYGVTEAAPGIAMNTAMHDKTGTVGRLLPKIEYCLQPIEGIEKGGRLYIKGPNIMQGYIKADNPGVIQDVDNPDFGKGWHDTGDIVSVDHDRYITILGRAKRFAKIAGEMISLAVVEDMANSINTLYSCASVCIEDNKKGEQIILFTTNKDLQKSELLKTCKEKKLSELHMPRIIIYTNDFPVLATGKLNYRLLIEMAKAKLGIN